MKEVELDAQKIAYLLSRDWNPKDIIQFLGLNLAAFQYRKEHAVKSGWLMPWRFCPDERVEVGELERNLGGLSAKFYERFWRLDEKQSLREVCVTPVSVEAGAADQLEQFGIQAATFLGRMLKNASTVGVAWGANLGAAIRGLALARRGGEHAAIRFFPIRGELSGQGKIDNSPFRLAIELDRIVNGGASGGIDTLTIPAIVPASHRGPRARALLDFLEATDAYRQMKGSLEIADCLLTSAGPANAVNEWTKEAIRSGGLPEADLQRLAWGDLAGIYIAKEQPSPLVEKWNRKFLGLQLQDVLACATRAAKDEIVGTVVVAAGKQKARVIVACLRLGLINRLIVDRALAAEAAIIGEGRG